MGVCGACVRGLFFPSELKVRLERSGATAEGVVRLQAGGVDADEALNCRRRGDAKDKKSGRG